MSCGDGLRLREGNVAVERVLRDVGDVVRAAELDDFEGLTRCRFEMCVAFGVVGARMVV